MPRAAQLLWTTSLISLISLLACAPVDEPGGEASEGSEGESDAGQISLEHGMALYAEYCAFCHGEAGEGYAADNANALANQEFLRLASDEFLATSVRYGRPGTAMSAWGEERAGPLTAGDIDDLVAFIRSWQEVEDAMVDELELDPSASVIRGETYYQVYGCEGCHGELGRGGEYMSLENPWFLTQVSDGYLRESITRGRPDTAMASFDDQLTALQIDDLAALIRSWEREVDSEPLPAFEPDVSDAALNPGGPDPDFAVSEGRYVGVDAVADALALGATMILLDARPHADFVDGHIEGAVSVPFFQLEQVIDALPQDLWIVSYCGCPHAISGQAFDSLAAAGFTKIAVLDEGYYEWVERGYPIAEGE